MLAARSSLPLVLRERSSRSWHDDTLWANSLRSLGGLEVPFDFAIFLSAAEDDPRGRQPVRRPGRRSARTRRAICLSAACWPSCSIPRRRSRIPSPGRRRRRSRVAASRRVRRRDASRCSTCATGAATRSRFCIRPRSRTSSTEPSAPYSHCSSRSVGAIATRRVGVVSMAVGAAVVLKVFLWPLLVWLAATRRWRATAGAIGVALALALVSWATIGFRGLAQYPELLRRLSDLEAENSYSAYAIAVSAGDLRRAGTRPRRRRWRSPSRVAWRAARSHGGAGEGDRRALTLALAAGVVLTPILWLHYLVLLVVPIALARPRLSALWRSSLSRSPCSRPSTGIAAGRAETDVRSRASRSWSPSSSSVVGRFRRARPDVDSPRGSDG